ncbi:MAG: diguanylate cyclase [Chitinispirillaceae bacterium]|nr:diguanylate cyclase [Chitinispirillaceae bacterium]
MVHVKNKTVEKEREFISRFLSLIQEGLWDWNIKEKRIYFSPTWKALIGYGEGEIGSDPSEWFSRIHEDDLPLVKRQLKKYLKGESSCFRSEHRIKHSDGSFRWVLVRGAGIYNEKGKCIRLTGTMTNFNEHKEHEFQLLRQLDELRFALASEKVLMEELDRKNKELTELSITDGLTGLYNHRYLQERLDFEIKRIKRYGGNLSCFLIDIDNFKIINDTKGHLFGDYVLKEIATLIRKNSREVDICGRYGGEEFLIITNLTEENATLFAKKLHNAIRKHQFFHKNKKVKVTVSIGVTGYDRGIKSKNELIERADKAMYKAKREGKDRICVWKELYRENVVNNKYCLSSGDNSFKWFSTALRNAFLHATAAFIDSLEAKYQNFIKHSTNVAEISVAIANKMGVSKDYIDIIRFGALLHDIGKIYLTEEKISFKPKGRKDSCFRQHPEIGVRLIEDVKFVEEEVPLILYHHECFDGRGFPFGLKGREIPIGARIISVADYFENMVMGRKYKGKKNLFEILKEIAKEKGKKFSADVVEALISAVKSGSISKEIIGSHTEKEKG